MKNFFDNVVFFIIRCILAAIQALSVHNALVVARFMGSVGWLFMPQYRATSLRNLDIVYGETKTQKEKKAIAIKSFQHFVSVTIELLLLPRLYKRPDFWQRVQFEGRQHLDEALARNKSIIFVTGHTGSWELCAFASSILNMPLMPVARPLDNSQKLNEYMMDLRRKSGIDLVYKRGALRTMVRALKDGTALAFIMDQNAGRNGVLTNFFGEKVSTHPSAAAMAMKFDAPVVAVYAYRVGKGFNYRIHIEPIVEMAKTGNEAADLQKNTQRIVTILESFVSAHPEQWLWSHRRFRLKKKWFAGSARMADYADQVNLSEM